MMVFDRRRRHNLEEPDRRRGDPATRHAPQSMARFDGIDWIA
jgi:hypothetical protein